MDIYCIGDMNYLREVLNGVAMLYNSHFFSILGAIGMIAAALIIGFQTIMTNRVSDGFPWTRMLVALIAFKFLFGSATTVYLYDTYSGKNMSVGNVPYGIAATGSIISKLAHEITLKLEEAFSLPTMTEGGFAGPLQTLTVGQQFYAGLSAINNGNIVKTLVEYCDKCTSAGINKGDLNIDNIKVAADPWAAMQWPSDIYYANTWLPTDTDQKNGTPRTCTDAWSAINDYLKGDLWSNTQWNKFLSAQICNEGEGSCDPVSTVQDALNNLANSEQDAQNYMLASVLLPAFEQGQINFNSFMGKPEMSIIVGQAREQRNVQWQAEGSLFMNIARPMMAFFEGFLYAITPFMALLIAFVPSGLSLVGKYIMMFVWVQLWMPVLAILNQYTEMVAQKKLSVLIDGTIPLTSLQGNLMGCSAINDWLGVAGVLVASTPAISLALLYGGAITMTHLAGRLQHGMHVDPKIMAPDVVSPGAALSVAPGYSSDRTMGMRKTGAEAMAPWDEVSTMAGKSAQSDRTDAVRDSQSAMKGIVNEIAHGQTANVGSFQQSESGTGVDASYSHNVGANHVLAKAVAKRYGMSEDHVEKELSANSTETYAGLDVGAGLGGVGGARIGAGANYRTKIENQTQDSTSNREEKTTGKNLNIGVQKSVDSGIMEKVLTMAKNGELRQFMDTNRQGEIDKVEKSAGRALESINKYQESEKYAENIGSGQKINRLAEAEFAANGGMGESAESYMARWHMSPGLVNQEAIMASRTYGVSGEQAKWMGILGAAKINSLKPGAEGNVASKIYLGVVRRMGMHTPETGNAHRNKDIVPVEKLKAGGDAAERESEAIKGPPNVPNNIRSIGGSTKGMFEPQVVYNRFNQNYGRFIDEAAKRYDVPPKLINALMMPESGGNPNATSPKGAMGLMQLMPKTATALGVKNPYDPHENIMGGTAHFARLYKNYEGDKQQLPKAIAAYNAGERRVPKNIPLEKSEAWTYPETRGHVNKVLFNYNNSGAAQAAATTARSMSHLHGQSGAGKEGRTEPSNQKVNAPKLSPPIAKR